MGFELKRLMRERGVATPGMAAYSGTTRPAALAADASAADKAAFDEAMRRYNLDQTAYNQYRQEYERRISGTPQYLQSQFNTSTGANVPAAMTFSRAQKEATRPGGMGIDQMSRNIQEWFRANPNATQAEINAEQQKWGISDQDVRNAMGIGFRYGAGTSGYGSPGVNAATARGGIGMDQYNRNIQNWFAQNPFATNEQIAAEKAKWGVSDRDIYNATGSYYGAPLRAPAFGTVPSDVGSMTAQQKADYYAQQRRLGYTDADLRGFATNAFGSQSDADWNMLRTLAGYGSAQPDPNARSNLPTNPERRTALNTTDGTTGVTDTTTVGGTTTTGGTTGVTDSTGGTGSVFTPTINFNVSQTSTPQQKAAEYNRLLALGYNNDQIRNAATSQFGPQTDVDWSQLQTLAGTLTLPSVTLPGGGVRRDFNDSLQLMSHGGGVHDMAQKYNVGGAVRRFQIGGNEGEEDERIETRSFPVREPQLESRMLDKYDMLPDSVGNTPIGMNRAAPDPTAGMRSIAAYPPAAAPEPVTASPAVQPVAPPPSATTPVSPAATDLMTMLQRYTSAESPYAADLAKARTKLDTESKAFENLLTRAMKPGSNAPDKTELYFRLAAAFGSPSKTGRFTENLALAGREAAEYTKDVRASKKAEQQLALQLGLEAQKMRMQGAREELTALRGLAGEEMKDKRAVLLEYLKTGRPQSEAGKAAVDAGLTQGTPEFTAFVNKYIEDKIGTGNMLKEAMVSIAAGGLKIREKAEERAAEGAKKLTPTEIKLKTEAEDRLTTIDSAMSDLGRAFDLNKNSFDTTLKDTAVRVALEQTGSKDPKVLATRELDNLLKSAMISSAAEKMKGVLSDSDIKLLQSVAGLDAKSKEERAAILRNAYRSLRTARQAQQKKLNEISQGLYRETSPAPAGPGED